MDQVVSQIIQDTFAEVCPKQTGNTRAFRVEFRFPVPIKEIKAWAESDDTPEPRDPIIALVLYGAANYIGVYTDETINGERVVKCFGYHDSCWRDSLDCLLMNWASKQPRLFSFGAWYKVKTLSVEEQAVFAAAREARYGHQTK